MSRGVRLATAFTGWWVGAYTATAPDPDGADRRAEVESDLFEQQAAAGAAPRSSRLGRGVLGRTLRGMPDDVTWRIEAERTPGRLHWHLAHPTTVLGCSLVVGLVAGQAADSSRARMPLLSFLDVMLQPLLTLLWAATVGFAVVALRFVRLGWRPRAVLETESWRRATVCAMSVTYAVSGLWRWAPGSLGVVVSVVWGLFGLSLLAWLATTVARLGTHLSRTLDFGKVSS